MSCLGPLTGYWSKVLNPSGKRSLVFRKEDSLTGQPVSVPCGQCINCRLAHAGKWAVRMVHETMFHEVNCFITLTYRDEPEGYVGDDGKVYSHGSLNYRDFQLFMKRLRERSGFEFKFYACGEYGDKNNRAHFHAILFGCDFNDRVYYKTNHNGDKLYTSDLLDDVWGLGFCTVGDVTFQSAAYCSGYVTKKITGEMADDHYMGRKPEMSHSSNGIGKAYIAKYGKQVFDLNNIVLNGKSVPIPRYYDNLYDVVDPARMAVVKRERRRKALLRGEDLSNRRSWTREKVVKARLNLNRRDYEA